jgi:hypothetical protein
MAARTNINVGSASWALSERLQAAQFIEQETEEFSFSVRNDMEWLNEHMSEIFSKNQLWAIPVGFAWIKLTPSRAVTELFKTPGKLRGKTPRTARKKNLGEARAVCI